MNCFRNDNIKHTKISVSSFTLDVYTIDTRRRVKYDNRTKYSSKCAHGSVSSRARAGGDGGRDGRRHCGFRRADTHAADGRRHRFSRAGRPGHAAAYRVTLSRRPKTGLWTWNIGHRVAGRTGPHGVAEGRPRERLLGNRITGSPDRRAVQAGFEASRCARTSRLSPLSTVARYRSLRERDDLVPGFGAIRTSCTSCRPAVFCSSSVPAIL